VLDSGYHYCVGLWLSLFCWTLVIINVLDSGYHYCIGLWLLLFCWTLVIIILLDSGYHYCVGLWLSLMCWTLVIIILLDSGYHYCVVSSVVLISSLYKPLCTCVVFRYQIKCRLRSAHFDCLWDTADDSSLLRGVYEYGFGNWDNIKLAVDLGLHDKVGGLVNSLLVNSMRFN